LHSSSTRRKYEIREIREIVKEILRTFQGLRIPEDLKIEK